MHKSRAYAMKPLEDSILIFARYAYAAIRYRDGDPVPLFGKPDFDLPGRAGILDGVVEQVDYRLRDRVAVNRDLRQSRARGFKLNLKIALLEPHLEHLQRVGYDLAHVRRMKVIRFLAGLDSRKLQ